MRFLKKRAPRKKNTKKQHANHVHLRRRIAQRFGIYLNQKKHAELVRRIREQDEVEFVSRQTGSRTLWRLNFEGRDLMVLYDKNQKNIITALFPDEMEIELSL